MNRSPASQSTMEPSGRHDLTADDLKRSVWHLAWPIIFGQVLLMLPMVYDTIWLGQIGRDAQAAAGLVISVRITMISVLMGLSLGGGAVIARCLGAGEVDKADLAVLQGVILMIGASGSLGLVGIVLARPLLLLAGADAATLPLAIRYAHIIFAGLIAMEMVPSLGFMMSGAGAPRLMLSMTLLSVGTLLISEPLLVRWMGLDGAALALVGSNTVGAVFGLILLAAGRAPARLDLRNLRLDLPMMGRILRISFPAVLQRGTPNLAMSFLMRLTSSYGPSTLAAWVIAKRITDFAIIPGMGLARTLPAMVGQNLGAGKPERAVRSVSLVTRSAALVAGCILGLLALLAPQVLSLFSADAETVAIGSSAIRILGIGYMAFVVSTALESAQSGAGDTVSPMFINIVSLWGVQVPAALLLSRPVGLGAAGIWIALVLGWILQATLMVFRVRQGRWKLKRV